MTPDETRAREAAWRLGAKLCFCCLREVRFSTELDMLMAASASCTKLLGQRERHHAGTFTERYICPNKGLLCFKCLAISTPDKQALCFAHRAPNADDYEGP